MIDENYIKTRLAPCGLHCRKCFAFREGEIHENSIKLKEYLGNFGPYAERFAVHLNPIFANYPEFKVFLDYLAKSECSGCRKEQCKFYKNCNVRSCSEERRVDFCYQCSDFPCSNTGFDENLYKRHVAINKKIQEIGIKSYYDQVKDIPRY